MHPKRESKKPSVYGPLKKPNLYRASLSIKAEVHILASFGIQKKTCQHSYDKIPWNRSTISIMQLVYP